MSYKQYFIIVNEGVRENVKSAIDALPVAKYIAVEIKEARRSQAQNALYWLFIDTIRKELGNTKEEQHTFYAAEFLDPIWIHIPDSRFGRWMQSTMEDAFAGIKRYTSDEVIHELLDYTLQKIKNQPIPAIKSTASLSVSQFTEYLELIEAHAYQQGITLPRPDFYKFAMYGEK